MCAVQRQLPLVVVGIEVSGLHIAVAVDVENGAQTYFGAVGGATWGVVVHDGNGGAVDSQYGLSDVFCPRDVADGHLAVLAHEGSVGEAVETAVVAQGHRY